MSHPRTTPMLAVPSSRKSANPQACVTGAIPPYASTRRKSIARSAHGLNETIVAESLKRLAQPPDVNIDRALLHVDISAPDPVEQLVATIDALRVRHKELQHAVFGRPKPYRLSSDQHPMAGLIQRQALDLDALF